MNKRTIKTKGIFLFVIVSLAICVAIAFSALRPVSAAIFNCPPGDANCLIWAINDSNANDEADTVNLATGTYILRTIDNGIDSANGVPSITTKITIRGIAGETVIMRSEEAYTPDFRIFHVGNTGDLELDELIIMNGSSEPGSDSREGDGGAIFNLGTLTIKNSTIGDNFSNDEGGGISNSGILKIRNSTIKDNLARGGSGGIDNFGTATITNTTIENNVAGLDFVAVGGGISNFGDCTLRKSTVRNNTVADNGFGGGGIITFTGSLRIENCDISNNSDDSGGGGIHHRTGIMSIVNSTIANNHSRGAGGGIYVNFNVGEATIINSTVANNSSGSLLGGGIFAGGSKAQIQNTIIAGNSGKDCFSEPRSLGNNIIGNINGCNITLLPSDITGDPGLGPFTDPGLPGRGHFPLLPDSQAIDMGNDDACLKTTDQLGNRRFDGDSDGVITCDIGAVEFHREENFFPNSEMKITLGFKEDNPFGVTEGVVESVSLIGPTTVHVFIGPNGEAFDQSSKATQDSGQIQDLPNFLDEVQTEIVQLELTGTNPLGPVAIRLRDPSKDPFMMSVGQIEEKFDNNAGRLDLEPYTKKDDCMLELPDGCMANSFFDLFFEIEVGGHIFHNRERLRVETIITHNPPAEFEVNGMSVVRYISIRDEIDSLPLFKEDNTWAGVELLLGETQTFHEPRCSQQIVNALIGENGFQIIETSSDVTPVEGGPVGTFTVSMKLMNKSSKTIYSPIKATVSNLTGDNMLLSVTEGNGAVGSKQEIPGDLLPGEMVDVKFEIGLATRNPFKFSVDVEGCIFH